MIKFSRQISLLFIFIAALLTAGFGCKGLSGAQQAAVKPVSLEYWTVFDDVDALGTLINKYHVARPYLTVHLRQVRSDELYPRLVEALAEDHGPDIISISNRSLGTFLSKLASLPPTVQDTVVNVQNGTLGNTTDIITNTNNTVTLDQLDREYVQTVKGDVVRGGKIYGLPLSLDTMAIYYKAGGESARLS